MAGRLEERRLLTSAGPIRFYQGPCVYEPSDDTWVAVEALESLRAMGYSFRTVLDLGSGTGVLAGVAAALFRPYLVVAVDISPYAVEASRGTLGRDAAVVQCNAASCIRRTWDLVIVNPPYLPTPLWEAKECEGLLSLAWSEGAGHEVLCKDAGRLGKNVLIVRSSASSLDVDSCLTRQGHTRSLELARRRLFFESIWAELWSRQD